MLPLLAALWSFDRVLMTMCPLAGEPTMPVPQQLKLVLLRCCGKDPSACGQRWQKSCPLTAVFAKYTGDAVAQVEESVHGLTDADILSLPGRWSSI